MEKADRDDWWPWWVWVGECFFWYRLTRVVPDKIQRAVKRLCVCVCTLFSTCHFSLSLSYFSRLCPRGGWMLTNSCPENEEEGGWVGGVQHGPVLQFERRADFRWQSPTAWYCLGQWICKGLQNGKDVKIEVVVQSVAIMTPNFFFRSKVLQIPWILIFPRWTGVQTYGSRLYC